MPGRRRADHIDAARANGIDIPSLGYDPRVTPPSNVEAAFVELHEKEGIGSSRRRRPRRTKAWMSARNRTP
jgi:hypothetical protein